MKYLIAVLIALAAGGAYLQLQTWEKRHVVYLAQAGEFDKSYGEKKRLAGVSQTLPADKMWLLGEVDRIREQSHECYRMILETAANKPFGLPLTSSEQVSLRKAKSRLAAIDAEKRDEGYQRASEAAAEEARKRAMLQRPPPQTPKPGDWMWQERSGNLLERNAR